IGVEAGRIEDGVVGAEESRDLSLEFAVQVLRAADEADRGEAEAVVVEGLLCGGGDARMIGEAEVVVGAEVQHLLTGDEADAGILRGGDDALLLVQGVAADLVELLGEALLQAHGVYSQLSTTLPHWPEAMRSKPVWKSSIGRWCVSTGRRSRPPSTIWVI